MSKNPDNKEGVYLNPPRSRPIRFLVPNGTVTPTYGARPVDDDKWDGFQYKTATTKVKD